jgi:hypothetical protein
MCIYTTTLELRLALCSGAMSRIFFLVRGIQSVTVSSMFSSHGEHFSGTKDEMFRWRRFNLGGQKSGADPSAQRRPSHRPESIVLYQVLAEIQLTRLYEDLVLYLTLLISWTGISGEYPNLAHLYCVSTRR